MHWTVIKEIFELLGWMGGGLGIAIAALLLIAVFPSLTRLLIEIAIVAFVATLLYGAGAYQEHKVCNARIEALKQAAADARDARDAEIKTETERGMAPVQQRIDDDERHRIAQMSASGGCKLGPAAFRLRPQSKTK